MPGKRYVAANAAMSPTSPSTCPNFAPALPREVASPKRRTRPHTSPRARPCWNADVVERRMDTGSGTAGAVTRRNGMRRARVTAARVGISGAGRRVDVSCKK